MEKQFVYSLDDENFGEFEQMQDEVNDQYEPESKVCGSWGVLVPISHLDFVNEINIVEDIQQIAYDKDGDFAEDYLLDMTEDMEQELREVIAKFLTEKVAAPKWYRVDDVQEYIFTAEGL